MPAFHELSTAQLRQALQLREQIESLQQKLNALLGSTEPAPKQKSATGRTPRRRTMSAEAREKIRVAQQARWAKVKSTSTKSVGAAKRIADPKKKGGLTAEGRARLATAMKERWAAKKKGAPAPNAPSK